MTLLSINGVDFTKNIVVPSWAINSTEIATAWTDGNGIFHRDVTRTRVTGTFSFKDRSRNQSDDYAAFRAALDAVATANNAYTLTVWINNEEQARTIESYLTYTPSMTRSKSGGPIYPDAFQIRLEER